jgi:dienelactone hydrolase
MNQDNFFNLLGPLKNKCDLKPKVLESLDCGEYIQEKIEYSVEPQERIKAYILLPKKRKPKTPAVYCHHQHSSNYNRAKSEVIGLKGDPDLAYAKELVQNGFITFAPDAIAFEDRNWHSESWWGVEYFELATRLVKGETLLGKVLSDVSVGIDYLMTRHEVDGENIGFIGHSYGGRMAIWSPVFDERIKVSVSNCYCINYKNSLLKSSGTRIPMELCVPGILKYGDIEDIVKLIEPCSLYISVAEDDKWSRDAKEIYDYAKNSFVKGELKLKIWPGGHAFSKEMRKEAYSFLNNHLCT